MAMFTGTGAILLALSAGMLHGSTIGIPREEFRASYTLAATGRIVLQNVYGDVDIVAWDRDEVMVHATKHSTDPRHLNDAQIVVDSAGELVSIHTQYTGSD